MYYGFGAKVNVEYNNCSMILNIQLQSSDTFSWTPCIIHIMYNTVTWYDVIIMYNTVTWYDVTAVFIHPICDVTAVFVHPIRDVTPAF